MSTMTLAFTAGDTHRSKHAGNLNDALIDGKDATKDATYLRINIALLTSCLVLRRVTVEIDG